MNTYELTWTGRQHALATVHTPPAHSVSYVGPLDDGPLDYVGPLDNGPLDNGPLDEPNPPATTPATQGREAIKLGATSALTIPASGSMVIEGDNIDALKHLQATHTGRVAVIYIDPPYNTGNTLPYHDTFGAAGHAGWMSMMLPRLTLAHSLMRNDGVIFVSIDDRELAFLTLVGHQVFGEDNFLGSFTHQRAKGGGQARTWVRGHDYIAVWAKNKPLVGGFIQKKQPPATYETINGESFLIDDDVLRTTFGKYTRGTERRLMYEDIEAVRGPKKKAQVDQWLRDGTHILRPWGNGKHAVARLTPAKRAVSKMYSIIRALSHEGRDDLEELGLGGIFGYPKPVSLLRTLIRSRTFFDAEAVVLDFFAGSGTTGQAVMELNAEDGGKREFILVQKPEALKGVGPARPGAPAGAAPAGAGSPATISQFARQRIVAAARSLGVDPAGITDVRLSEPTCSTPVKPA